MTNIMTMIKRLLPSTKLWMFKKGYLERVIEDGVEVVRLTQAGHEYFVKVLRSDKR